MEKGRQLQNPDINFNIDLCQIAKIRPNYLRAETLNIRGGRLLKANKSKKKKKKTLNNVNKIKVCG